MENDYMDNTTDTLNNTKPEVKINVTMCLDTPVKSESDRKEYRVITLENGLTALMISDFKSNKTNGNKQYINKLEENMAACCLTVNVGSFSDPPEIHGMAHFLEHVISLGSDKYPEKNEYDKFIKEKGGCSHADTGYERTKYFFQIHPDYLLPAMDRFAHFFINPLLKRDVVLRERESIDNEFYMDLPSDYERLKHFFRIIPSDNHPASKFSCGNMKTLRDSIDENTLYSELEVFKNSHYSAHRMTLAVQATLPLDTLEEYVIDCFSDLPVNHLPPHNFTDIIGFDSFDDKKLKKIYKIKSINDTCEMELKWIMPPSTHLYKNKPINYILWIMNHEGKGSLSYYLRENKMCDRLSVNHKQYSIYDVFTLNLVLPRDGESSRTKEILDTVFSYINMLRRKGPQKRIYEEIQTIANNKFRFANEINAAINVQTLCCNMHLYPPTDYITGSNLYFEYDPDAIQCFLDHLTPKNVFIVILDNKFCEEDFDKTEPWYRIRYSSDEIPDDWIAKWEELEPFPEFGLPGPNPFIATDFQLIDLPIDPPNYPVKIEKDCEIEMWYKPDAKFRLPYCYVYLHLITPDSIVQSIHTCVMLRLFEILTHELVLGDLHDAKCAGLAYNVSASNEGVLVKINGFSEKVPLLLNILVKYVAEFVGLVKQDMFSLVKTELLTYYSSVLYDPGTLASEICSSILESDFWMSTDKHATLSNINFDQFIDFAKHLTADKVHVQCLVQGNITQMKAVTMIRESIQPLKCCSLLPKKSSNVIYGFQVPLDVKCYRVKNLNPYDVNSVVMNYYQTDTKYSKLCLPIFKEFLGMLMQEPLFHQLRTKEQLGYSVSCSVSPCGFNVAIYSPTFKFTTEYLDERIDCFVKHFVGTLKQMSENEFNATKECFIKVKQCAGVNLKDEVEQNWFAINNKSFVFDESSELISTISSLTIDEFRQWVDDYDADGKCFKKLSVQVVGNVDLLLIINVL